MENKKSVFETLFEVDVTDQLEKKKAGNTELTYLSWPYAWAEVKRRYPDASFTIWTNENGLPYVYDEKTGFMVFVSVFIEGQEFKSFLPVMDSNNKAMKADAYTYKVKHYEYGKWDGKTYDDKLVEGATMFDINKTIQRCLVKALAMAGLGLYVFAGEDINDFANATAVPTVSKERLAQVEAHIAAAGTTVAKVVTYFNNKPLNLMSEDELKRIDEMCDRKIAKAKEKEAAKAE